MSKIATETATNLLAVFAGQTVTIDEVFDQVEQIYTLAQKRTGMASYAQILSAIERAGVTVHINPADTTDQRYTFPTVAA